MYSGQSWTYLSNTGLTDSRYLNCGRFTKNLGRERKHTDTMSLETTSYFTRLSIKRVFAGFGGLWVMYATFEKEGEQNTKLILLYFLHLFVFRL